MKEVKKNYTLSALTMIASTFCRLHPAPPSPPSPCPTHIFSLWVPVLLCFCQCLCHQQSLLNQSLLHHVIDLQREGEGRGRKGARVWKENRDTNRGLWEQNGEAVKGRCAEVHGCVCLQSTLHSAATDHSGLWLQGDAVHRLESCCKGIASGVDHCTAQLYVGEGRGGEGEE